MTACETLARRSADSVGADSSKMVRRMSLMVVSMSSTAVEMRWAASGRTASRRGALECQADREQPLDHQVVQVPADPVAVLEDGQPAAVVARLGDLHRERGLVGVRLDEPDVSVEECPLRGGRPADGEHSRQRQRRAQRHEQQRAVRAGQLVRQPRSSPCDVGQRDRSTVAQHIAQRRAPGLQRGAEQVVLGQPVHRDDPEPVVLVGEQDDGGVGTRHLAGQLGDPAQLVLRARSR